MPGLECRENEECYIEETGCFVQLPLTGTVILFVDAEAIGITGKHCDCIVTLKRSKNNKEIIEIFSVDLKSIRVIKVDEVEGFTESIKSKCINCIDWVKSKFPNLFRQNAQVINHCVLVAPRDIFESNSSPFRYIKTLIKNRLRFHITQIFEDIRIVECNVTTVMGGRVWHSPTEGETSCTGILMIITSKRRIIERDKISNEEIIRYIYDC